MNLVVIASFALLVFLWAVFLVLFINNDIRDTRFRCIVTFGMIIGIYGIGCIIFGGMSSSFTVVAMLKKMLPVLLWDSALNVVLVFLYRRACTQIMRLKEKRIAKKFARIGN